MSTEIGGHRGESGWRFAGEAGREHYSNHRVAGLKGWCFECSQWCYGDVLCAKCEVPALRAERDALKAELAEARATIERLSARHQPKTAVQITPCRPSHAASEIFRGDCGDCRKESITVCSNLTCCGWPCEDRKAIDAALDTPGAPDSQPEVTPQEASGEVDWEAIARQRERELRQVGEARHRAESVVEQVKALRDIWNLLPGLRKEADALDAALDASGGTESTEEGSNDE